MKPILAIMLCFALLLGATALAESDVTLSDDASDFVLLSDAVPDAILEIRYYSTYNFVGDRIDGYEEPVALLTKEAAAALKEVSDELIEKGYRLKIFDAYRPQMAVSHFMRWALDFDDTRMKAYFYPELEKDVLFPLGYIAEHSGHSRGSTVDLTLFDMTTEKEVDMGGTFDYFGEKSHPDYTGITEEQYANRMILREAMLSHGFKPLVEEWWHFTLAEEPYPDTYFTFPVSRASVAQADTALTEAQQALFERALEGLLGVQYTPVAVLSTTLGDNARLYGYLASATVVYPGAEPYDVLVDIQEDAQGEVSLMNIRPISAASAAEAAADGLHASIQPTVDSPEWVKNLPAAQDEATKQLFVVAGYDMASTTASVTMHQRDENGAWKQLLSTPGFVGKNGLCPDADHAEGCAQTPIGTYHFNAAFGIAADPGCALPYTQVDADIYWSGDESQRYNEMVNIQDYPTLDMTNSEHILDYEYQYQYCLNISFNEEGAPGRGSAIFLHCLGPVKPYTGGCVAIPENIMKQVMQLVQPDCIVVIDTMAALNVSF